MAWQHHPVVDAVLRTHSHPLPGRLHVSKAEVDDMDTRAGLISVYDSGN